MKSKLTLGSLFDGSGGFPLAGILSGIEPIWVSELEPFPIRVTTKRLPQVQHLGDISQLNGAAIAPVDVITFGSPCQNLSIAGNRHGLEGDKSSLFYQAIRIIKEMREETNGKYPRYIVWENVCGAFSSNKGADFKSVLEEINKIADESIVVAQPEKWANAGETMGENFSIAWRVLDAQYWGVPQRRKRIFLVADFDGQSATKILFESEGLSGYSSESFKAWQNATESVGRGTKKPSSLVLNDQGGNRMDVTDEMTSTLRATSNHPPIVFNWHHLDGRAKEANESAQTLTTRYGHNGVDNHFVVEDAKTYDVRFTSEGTVNSRANVYETDSSRTIDTSGNAPESNQGGIAVVSLQGSMIGRKDENGPQGSGINKDVSFTLNTVDKHAVIYCASKNSHFTRPTKELAGTLVETDYKDPPLVNQPSYVVRRLTPKECARLQGFPSWWCDDLETKVPTEEDLVFWREVFESYRLAVKPQTNPKSDKQIIKWIQSPHSDSAEYKLWGNGVALPCVVFVLSGISWASENDV